METQITLLNLERTSKGWDKRTKDILLAIGGAGNMFGGWSKLLHITLHGDNSMAETGTITVNGIAVSGYNIARGANGDSCSSLKYYKTQDTSKLGEPLYTIQIKGTCGGAEDALCSILSATKDWQV